MAKDTPQFFMSLRKRNRKEDRDDKPDRRKSARQSQLTKPSRVSTPITIRDKLVQRELMELTPEVLPITVSVVLPNADILHELIVRVRPNEGMWKHGTFDFSVEVPEDYNMSPPKVKCLTPIWHPNISFSGGNVCLSLLRVALEDEMGWTPTRGLKDVVLGLDALFGDLVNFEDPLNKEAADMYLKQPGLFAQQVTDFIRVHVPPSKASLKISETRMIPPSSTSEAALPPDSARLH